MDGLFYLMSIMGVGLVMWWVIQNDAVPPDRATKGMFAMLSGAQLARKRRLRGWISALAEAPKRRKSKFD